MSQTNDFNTMNAAFKETYADNIKDLTPDGLVVYNMIDFVSAERMPGNLYHQPVTLGLEHGFTYGGSGGTAFGLRNGVSSTHEDAQIRGHEMVLRSYLAIGAVSRSKNQKGAFIQASKLIVENMLKSFSRRLEVQLMYGQAEFGLGRVDSVSTNTITVSAYEWAAGIWSGAEKMPIEIRRPSTSYSLIGEASVTSVSLSAKSVTVDLMPAGTAAGDAIFYAGAYGKEFAGIHKIITNSGSLFNIDASVYSLWSGNIVSVGTDATAGAAVLSFAKVEESIASGMEKGLSEEDVLVICNPKSWNNLLTEQAAKRMYDSSYSSAKVEQGSRSIVFHGQNGKIEVKSSIFCKEGFAYVVPVKTYMRIGSSDVTMEQPGFEGRFIKLLENANAYELRAYTDQALFCSAPGLSSLLRFVKS
jgi:hypothetical protein